MADPDTEGKAGIPAGLASERCAVVASPENGDSEAWHTGFVGSEVVSGGCRKNKVLLDLLYIRHLLVS